MRDYGKWLMASVLVATFVMVTGDVAQAAHNTGLLRIENLDREDYSFRVDPQSKNIVMKEGVSKALPILVRAGGVVQIVVKDSYYTLQMLGEHHSVRLRVKDDRTTSLTIRRGGESGYDLLAEVSRRGRVQSLSTLEGEAIQRHHTPPVIVQPQPAPVIVWQPAPVVVAPQPLPQVAPIIVQPAPCAMPAPVVVQPSYWQHPYYGSYGRTSSHYRPYYRYSRGWSHNRYRSHSRSHHCGSGFSISYRR